MPNRVIKFKRALGGSQYRTFGTGGIGGLTPLAPVGGRTTMMRRVAGARLVGAGRGGREQRGVIGARLGPRASALQFGGNGAVRGTRGVVRDVGGVPYAPPGTWAVPKRVNRFSVSLAGRYAVRGPDGSTTDPAKVERAAMDATIMDTLRRYGLDRQTGGNSHAYTFGFLIGTMDKPSEQEWAVFQKLLMQGVAERDLPQTEAERATGPFAFLADPDAWHKQRWATYLQNNDVAAGYYASDEQGAAFSAYQMVSGAGSLTPDVAGDYLRWRYDNRGVVSVLDAAGAYGRWRNDSDNRLGAEAMEGIGLGAALVALPYAAQGAREVWRDMTAPSKPASNSLYTPLMDAARNSPWDQQYREWLRGVAAADKRAAFQARAAGLPPPPSAAEFTSLDTVLSVYLGASLAASAVSATAGAARAVVGPSNFDGFFSGVGDAVGAGLDAAGRAVRPPLEPIFRAIDNAPRLDRLFAPPPRPAPVPSAVPPSVYGYGEVNGGLVALGPDGRPAMLPPKGMYWVQTSTHNGVPEFTLSSQPPGW